ncbi:hypothetical protein THIOM_003705 [Candidatus Thiomargarita nelsonii]|uniref:Uncharacterized protein n=1 Tax=Candidatus Thiomargarita nelsonii TaxID=1003181 RepID=A0A176RXS5_9GAMM|nr:hypothetical protein THIOM_003705 [Candidatus Thiomargarita nelsonii]
MVQEAAETTLCCRRSKSSSLMPITVVIASSGILRALSLILKGADKITTSAPASKCPRNAPFGLSPGTVGSVNAPVVSTTSRAP